ncbi:MAG TPA: glycerol acyltransferase [Epsilonproteobacteria bacterium]|mgnify:CR=1 FL=1|nr:glycerol acyltransferase [Campylobacterota bacterium]
MNSPNNIDIPRIEQTILKLSKLVKEVAVFMHQGQLFALIYPDLEEAKKQKLIRIENEIRWYAVELYNLKAKNHQKIKGYQIVRSPLPKQNNGEISRAELELFLKEQRSKKIGGESEPEDGVYQTVKKFLSTRTTEPVLPSSHLEFDLHLDSLNYIELFTFIEQSFGVTVDETCFSQMMVLHELSRYVREKKQKQAFADIDWSSILHEKIDFDLHVSPVPVMIYKTLFLPLYKLYFSLRISGDENIPKAPCIIAPSHQSMLDGFILAAALPYNVLKHTFFLAFEMVFGTKIMSPVIRNSQTILINVNKDLKASVQKSAVPLKRGQNLVVFPEGARSRDRELLEFKRFFAILSVELNIPVVPTVLDGTFESMPAGRLFPRPSPVVVKYLAPIYPEGLSYDELTEKVREAIATEMRRHPLHG